MSESFFETVCLNFKDEAIINYSIGYSHMSWPFIIIPSLALILNLFIIVTHIRKNLQQRKLKLNQNSSSIEQMLYFLTIVETLISLYWLCNGIVFYDVEVIQQSCEACFFNSIFFIFIQSFDWIFFTCSLHNILSFIQDPMKEHQFQYRLKLYIILSLSFSSLFTYAVFATGTYGLSPMLTCFIKNKFRETSKDIAVYSILLFPTIYLIFSIYYFVKAFSHRHVKASYELTVAVRKYLIYSLLYIVFYFPTILLYLLSINQEIEKETFLSWFSYFCSLATVSINLALCMFRILEGYVKCNWKALLVHQELDESLMTENSNMDLVEDKLVFDNEIKISMNENLISVLGNTNSTNNNLTENNSKNFNQLFPKKDSYKIRKLSSWNKISMDMIQGFMRNFFLGLIMTLEKSSKISTEKIMKSKYFTEEITYNFKNKQNKQNDNISENSDLFNLSIFNNENINIEVKEFAPKVFKKIRQLEGISEDEIIESLNPVNNTTIIKSQGKSSSFFISTDDSKLVLKTLKREEFDNIFNKFLIFYLPFIEENVNSLICRIYGIFSVKVSSDADPLMIILMRDAKGPLKNFIKTTYDLKGSLYNRETPITESNKNQQFLTRKDLNYLREEINLELKLKTEFMENVKRDSEFLEDLNLMDYSLLLLKMEFDECSTLDFIKFIETKDYQYYKRHIYYSSKNKNTAYLCIIIDYLQDFSFFKKMENNLKNLTIKSNDISCVPADEYSKRFIEFFVKITNE